VQACIEEKAKYISINGWLGCSLEVFSVGDHESIVMVMHLVPVCCWLDAPHGWHGSKSTAGFINDLNTPFIKQCKLFCLVLESQPFHLPLMSWTSVLSLYSSELKIFVVCQS
jgi:hypothetical protein